MKNENSPAIAIHLNGFELMLLSVLSEFSWLNKRKMCEHLDTRETPFLLVSKLSRLNSMTTLYYRPPPLCYRIYVCVCVSCALKILKYYFVRRDSLLFSELFSMYTLHLLEI